MLTERQKADAFLGTAIKIFTVLFIVIGYTSVFETLTTSKREYNAPAFSTAVVPDTSNVVFDFDANYTVKHDADQAELDDGFIIELYGDYYHHNTKQFLSDIRSLTYGNTIKIDNNFYTFNHIEKAHASINNGYGHIISESGNIVEYNSSTEIITCASDTGSDYWNRYIVFLD